MTPQRDRFCVTDVGGHGFHDTTRRTARSGEPGLADDINCGAAEARVPESWEPVLLLHALRLKKYEGRP